MDITDHDLEAFRITGVAIETPTLAKIKAARRKAFIKLPIPLAEKVFALPGKSCAVMVAALHLAGMCRSRQVRLPYSLLAKWGVSKAATRRGLLHLESAGFVTVDRHIGRSPVVTILEEV